MRYPKHNNDIRLKSNILDSPNFWAGYATGIRDALGQWPSTFFVKSAWQKPCSGKCAMGNPRNTSLIFPKSWDVPGWWNRIRLC